MKKTKIICTIGPASESVSTLKELMANGMNVCRLNFSHGSHDEHKLRVDNIKKARKELDLPIAIMLDTKGPEIRLGKFEVPEVLLSVGDIYTFTTDEVLGNQKVASVTYKLLPNDVKVGGTILVDDGLVEMEIISKTDTDITCVVKNSGTIKSNKGVNIPNEKINLPSITEKDKQDILFAIENDFDFIAASFVRKPEDVYEIRKILEENNSDIKIISKIENQEGVENIDKIIEASDGIMVARGDLGVEIKTEFIPKIQKEIIRKCNLIGKPVITATQMLDSMIRNPRPTRAEVTDVANAIIDGSDCIMLSGETAAGKYPLDAVKVMRNIAITTEESFDFKNSIRDKNKDTQYNMVNAISLSAKEISENIKAKAIICATSSGITPISISKFRPFVDIIAVTFSEKVRRRLQIHWGVCPLISEKSNHTDEVIERSISAALKSNRINDGDTVVLTAGIPVGVAGTTNLIKVHTVGKILIKGFGIGKNSVTSNVCVIKKESDLKEKFKDGDIIVTKFTDREYVEYIERASGLIVEMGGLTSHAAIVSLHFNIPTIIGAENAIEIINDRQLVTIDTIGGLIYDGDVKVL
ncbi:MAG: pyruvate kinase [Peptoniphilaceae bacterium]|uniref:pyruvate kinase n=1 Tax=Parvimonas sp. TaxID=1944660 RepID=UPI0025E6051F|nr:pyruvate kinase [Parvimonas sp.]MCI5997795.1 pyruvate kinase [Parvimonas sp.]MDD7765280.1 pyruvate kinase [Peptoniphilaceae bacterium]MDY3050892.1 pyruvate kinase [Parvimonas sp.]